MNKKVEEMAKVMCDMKCIDCDSVICYYKKIAEALYNAGYTQKVKDDEIVLSISEVEEFRKDQAEVKFLKKQIQEETRKETAREILQELFVEAIHNRYGMVDFRQIKALAMKHGVEVK